MESSKKSVDKVIRLYRPEQESTQGLFELA